jgi:predicted DNA-binding antitoxin AbrB/MazE fold protein
MEGSRAFRRINGVDSANPPGTVDACDGACPMWNDFLRRGTIVDMIQHIKAIYDHGVLRPLEPLVLDDQAVVSLSVEAPSDAERTQPVAGRGKGTLVILGDDNEQSQNYAQRSRARSTRAIRNANSAMTVLYFGSIALQGPCRLAGMMPSERIAGGLLIRQACSHLTRRIPAFPTISQVTQTHE